MKFCLLSLLLVVAFALFAIPHPVYVEIRNSYNEIPEEGDIHFETWLLNNPDEVLTEENTDCYYPAFGSFVKVNTDQFLVYFPGDVLHLEVWQLSLNEWGIGEFVLNNEPSQFFYIDEGGIILTEEQPAPELDIPDNFISWEDKILIENFSEYITNPYYYVIMEENEYVHAEINEGLVSLIPEINWYGFETLNFTVTGWGGCEDSSEVLIHFQPVNDAPIVYDIKPEALEIDLNAGEELLFVAAVTDSDSEVDYLWRINGIQTGSNQCSYLHQFDEGGEYNVILTISDYEFNQEINWTVNVEQSNNMPYSSSPKPVMLLGNYPNPFNPSAIIRYFLTEKLNNPLLEIYNVRGQKLESIQLNLRGSSYIWNGKNKSSGIYFYRIFSDQYISQPRSMILLK